MKRYLLLILVLIINIKIARCQILNFGSTNWDYSYKQPVGGSCTPPSDSPAGVTWTSPSYVKPVGEWTFATQTLPIGYATNSSNIYGGISIISILPFGADPSNKPTTAYVRQTITLPNPRSSYSSFTIKVKADDGVRVYFNGIQVANHNLPSGSINANTPANVVTTDINNYTFNVPNTFATHPSDPNKITITAEIHQSTTDNAISCTTPSSDLFFDMELSGTLGPLTPTVTRGPYLQLPLPTAMQIRWQTNTTEIGKVCYSTSGPITGGNPGTCISESVANTQHIVNLTGLSQNTTYYYSIQNSSNTLFLADANHYFKTPPSAVNNSLTTRIWVTGDPSQDHYDDVQAQVLSAFEDFKDSNSLPAPDLWLLLGDIGNENGTLGEYDARFFQSYVGSSSFIMQQTPILASPGNHDYRTGNDITLNTALTATLELNNKLYPGWPGSIFVSPPARLDNRYYKNNPFFDLFSFPTNGYGGKYSTTANSEKKGYFSYNHNNIHFVCLDSYGFYNDYLLYGNIPDYPATSSSNSQFSWLIADLAIAQADPNIKWTIMFWHHSPYTKSGGHYSDLESGDEFILKGIRERLIKYLDSANFKIDLVLNGHSHSYQRSKLLKGHHGNESTFNPSTHNNPNLIAGFNSNASSDGKFTSIAACPYIKSETNAENEGVVYVVTGSAGQLQPDSNHGHAALNGGTFNNSTQGIINTEKEYGGSFYIEIKENRIDAKFINELGVIGDQFTIFKDVNTSNTLTKHISPLQLPTQTPDNQMLSSPNWPAISNFSIAGPTISGSISYSGANVSVVTPEVGPIYTIKDATGCLTQNYQFLFDGYCWPNVTIKNTINTPLLQQISSTGTITAKNLIKLGSNVIYRAKNAINLNHNGVAGIPLFEVQQSPSIPTLFNSLIVPNILLSCPNPPSSGGGSSN